jgi:hypothetical protein
MKIDHIPEPELRFGTGSHIDIRFGLMNFGPRDVTNSKAPRHIRTGIIGTPETVEGVSAWLTRCKSGISAKPSNQPYLFPRFPGCDEQPGLLGTLVTDSTIQRQVPNTTIKQISGIADADRAVEEAVALIIAEIEALKDKPVDVIVIAVPRDLTAAATAGDTTSDETGTSSDAVGTLDFHHLLKARAFQFDTPLQLVLPWTYDESKRPPRRAKPGVMRTLQDEATRAWNFHVALYYKARGIPWELMRDQAAYLPCYVGVSFYETLDKAALLTSVAQVFNERGEGLAVRGATAARDKDDRQPHLEGQGARDLLDKALRAYRDEHHHLPARVVLHKTSTYNAAEMEGFRAAADEHNLASLDLLSLGESAARLFRVGQYPPLRGTLAQFDDTRVSLYTRGSVDFFQTYPGLYVPQPLFVRLAAVDETPRFLAHEILALSKMNWNNTQFDGHEPITTQAARQVGKIIKYVSEDGRLQTHYRYYM